MSTTKKKKLTKTIVKFMGEYLANGETLKTAVDLCGFSLDTHYRWMHRGMSDKHGLYHDYHAACERGRNLARLAHRDRLETVVFERAETPHFKTRHTVSKILMPVGQEKDLVEKAIEDNAELLQRFHDEGVKYKEELQITPVLPDANLAIRILQRLSPEWREPEDDDEPRPVIKPDPNRRVSAWLDELFGITEPKEQCNYFIAPDIKEPATKNNVDIANAIATAKHPQIVISGPVGTGKTVLIVLILHGLCMRFPGFRILCLRNEASTMKTSLLETFKQVLYYGFSKTPESPLNAYGGEVNPSRLDYRNGSVIDFKGFDDPEKVRSSFYNLVFFNELQRYHNEQGWGDLTKRLRGNQVGWDRENGEQRVLKLADCNPSHPKHLVKRLEADGKLTLYPTTLEDNTAYFDRGEWTTEGRRYKNMLEEQIPKGSVSYARDILGEWVAAEGIVFSNFSEDKHVRAIVPADVPKDWRWVSALDYGFSVCAYGLFAHPPEIPDNVWGVGAVYKSETDTDDLWKLIVQLHEFWGAPTNIVCHADHDPSQSKNLRRKGLNIRNAKKREYLSTLDAVRRFLHIDGAFVFNQHQLIHPPDALLKARGECTDPLEEFSRFAYRADLTGNPEQDDTPIKRYNHYMDVVRYLAASHMAKQQAGGLHFSIAQTSAAEYGII